jgi:tRNA threonylcarbamoyl adenosine modification protein YeaZ
MKILAVEFSSGHRSVAVAESGDDGAVAVLGTAVEILAPKTQALTLVGAALAQARVDREQIECIAVGLGPGSYTGIRASISLAQGWQLARGLRLLGISSVECLAAQAQGAGWRGSVTLIIDAQRNEYYLARYDLGPTVPCLMENLHLVSAEEVKRRLEAGELVAGPEATRRFAPSRDLFPEAAMLARLAGSRTDYVSGEKLEPIYLRETTFVKAPPPRSWA